MDFFNNLTIIFTLLGISLLSIFFSIRKVLRKFKQFKITKETRRNCIKRYIELPYTFENQLQKCKLTKQLYKLAFKESKHNIILILGEIGSGKTCLINRFIIKYYLYAQLKGIEIVRIMGMECNNILESIEGIEVKNNTILFIDGLEESFIYKQNSINVLNEINVKLLLFYKIIFTINLDFYKENISALNDFYDRNADGLKTPPFKIFLKPFTDKMIKKYINKNIKVCRHEKQVIKERAFQNKHFFSRPLMLSFILFFEDYRGKYISQLEVLNHIFEKSLNWESNKFTSKKQTDLGEHKTKNIMNGISKMYLSGKFPYLKSKERVHNVLLEYDNQKREYRFQNKLFLYYYTIHKYYSKLCRNGKVSKYLYVYNDFRNIYFEKVQFCHNKFLKREDIILQFNKEPYLIIKNSRIFNEKWIMGLSKSLLNYKVEIDGIILNAQRINEISKQYFYKKYLDLHKINLKEHHLNWWSNLNVESLNISNTNLKEINIPCSWYGIRKIIAQNLPLRRCNSLINLSVLKELDLSGIHFDKVKDSHSILKLPDGINLDLSNCEITNNFIPDFLFNTIFSDLYLDNNKLTSDAFIYVINFLYLNVSNNPIIFENENIFSHKVICNFHFDDENITNYFCDNEFFLTYDKAIKLKEIDISNIEAKSMSGLEYLPRLKSITINLFQVPLLLDNMFTNTPLEIIKIKTYYLNQLYHFWNFYDSLENLVMHCDSSENLVMHYDSSENLVMHRRIKYQDINSSILNIIDFTQELLLECNHHCNENHSKAVGIKKMTDFLNIEQGIFYRRVVDAFNYAVSFCFRNYYENERIVLENTKQIKSEIDYEQKLRKMCHTLNLNTPTPCKEGYILLQFFAPIRDFFDKYVEHTSKDMETILNNRIGKNIKVSYVYPDGKIF